jgi:outer membrane protein W
MKKLFTILALCVIGAVAVQAQDYKKFRVGVGGGAAIPSGDGSKGGVLFYFEPGYRLTDDLIVNLRVEAAIMARGSASSSGDAADFDVSTNSSYTVNGQYYFKKGNFRPFAGVGFGIYKYSALEFDSDDANEAVNFSGTDESKFGFYPRVGFDFRHFTLSIDYNIVGKSTAKATFDGTTVSGDIKNSYLGIRIGGYFGGGKK